MKAPYIIVGLHQVSMSGKNALYAGQSSSQASKKMETMLEVSSSLSRREQLLLGGCVLAIAGTSSAKTIASPLFKCQSM